MLPHRSSPLRLKALTGGFLALVVTGALFTDPVAPERARLAATTSTSGQHVLRHFSSDAAFDAGAREGVRVARGSVTMSKPVGTMSYAGKRWAWSRWTSPWVQPGQTFGQLVPTWNAVTPANTFIRVQARVRSSSGRVSGWKLMGSWSARDTEIRRTSGSAQSDAVASVDVDTLKAASGIALTGYQLRVVPLRTTSSTATPTIRSLQAVASRPVTTVPATSRPMLPAKTLAVPRYSQMIHSGEYPQYGGGGQSWCSPTSLSMILGYYRSLPSAASYSWVDQRYADRWVDHVARVVYDHGYRGAGNWAFNTAYAANRTTNAFVTRLNSLREAERFIAAGIPLAASITFPRGGLTGAPISATAGHLVVITGFTASGDVVVNDPAASSNSTVRRTYDRAQFERAWLARSSGTVYVVRDAAHPLPARSGNRNW